MAGLTADGLEIKRFTDLQKEVQQSLIDNNTNVKIDSTSESVANNMFNPILLALAEVWELGQSVNNNYNIYKAEGVHLDELVGLNKVVRLKPKSSNGIIELITSAPQEVLVGSLLQDSLTKRITTDTTVNTDIASCSHVVLNLPAVVATAQYTITVEGVQYSETATGTSTPTTVMTALALAVTTAADSNATVTSDANNLTVTYTGTTNGSFAHSAQFTLSEVGVKTYATSIVEGALEFADNSVLNSITSIPNFLRGSVAETFTVGRLVETDEELRLRYLGSGSSQGNSTIPNIKATLLAVEGVNTVTITENRTDNIVGTLPPHSYSCLVFGGTDKAVAEAIFRSKPAGIETHGSIDIIVQDDEGDSHRVSLARPTETFLYVNVTYSLYAEETFPVNGEALIATAIANKGNSEDAGIDVLPDKFIGTAFGSTEGLSSVSIGVFSSSDDTLDPHTQAYSGNPIPVATSETSNYDVSRIIFTVV